MNQANGIEAVVVLGSIFGLLGVSNPVLRCPGLALRCEGTKWVAIGHCGWGVLCAVRETLAGLQLMEHAPTTAGWPIPPRLPHPAPPQGLPSPGGAAIVGVCAPVAQWIEHRPPEPGAGVRVAPGACLHSTHGASAAASGRGPAVGRLLWEQEVVGSNPTAPTSLSL